MFHKSLIHKFQSTPGSSFLAFYSIFLLGMILLVWLVPEPGLHKRINEMHLPFLDSLMKYWTYLGDGIVVALMLLAVLLVSFRSFFTGLAAFAFGGLSAQLAKHIFFPNAPRPLRYFNLYEPDYSLNLVEGVDMHTLYSFPSGHTSTAFAVYFALALMARKAWLQFLLFFIAMGVGFSRVYLSQHFMEDVLAGSVLGTVMGFFAWRWLRSYDKSWLDTSLLNVFNR